MKAAKLLIQSASNSGIEWQQIFNHQQVGGFFLEKTQLFHSEIHTINGDK